MYGKLKTWMFVSLIILLVELAQLVAHYRLTFLTRVAYGLALMAFVAMGVHYFFVKLRKR